MLSKVVTLPQADTLDTQAAELRRIERDLARWGAGPAGRGADEHRPGRGSDGKLTVTVGDDGRGDAAANRGTGLAGIERRLAAFDGTMILTSPPGGPTVVTMELPCELSSPKTSPSSGTG